MNCEQIIKEIKNLGIRVSDFGESDFPNTLPSIGQWEEILQVGGEGEGDTYYSVKYFKDHNVYIRTDGFYSSYNGTDWENGYGYEVFPKEKTITVYERN